MSTFQKDNALSSPAQHLRPETKADLEQMFLLIEGILPFEACLYYQVLPLSIEGSSLNLGMVNPEDTTAADYVRRQVSYINCSIASRPISSDWHREILSKFLSHSAKKNRQTSQQAQPQTSPASGSFADQPTLVVGAPTEIIESPVRAIPKPSAEATAPTAEETAPETPQPAPPSSTEPQTSQPAPPLSTEPQTSQPTPPLNSEPQTSQPAPPLSIEIDTPPDAQLETANLETATKDQPHQETLPTDSEEFNPKQFTPRELTQILLKRVITQEGIGRLYLERQSNTCRILWSKDGVVQSVVDDISTQLFQGVINELKRMMSISLIPVRKPKQIEIERIYNQKRILLRFRVMPGDHGEEATLQVLRGAALKFYQQQQIDSIGRDALGIAQDLQQRIDELRTQAQRNLDVQDTKQKTLPTIMSMLKQMEQQLHEILEAPE